MASTKAEATLVEVQWQAQRLRRAITAIKTVPDVDQTSVIAVNKRERIRTGLWVGVCAVVLGAAGVLVDTLGSGGLRVLGSVLIVFGMVGVGQALAIALGHMTPDAPRDGENRDAGGD